MCVFDARRNVWTIFFDANETGGFDLSLFVHLLGSPYIELDGARLTFPLRKAGDIVICAALGGTVTRDELKSMFWPDMIESRASANLRNALHMIRAAMPRHIAADRDSVFLRDFSSDVSALAAAADPSLPLPENIADEPLAGFGAFGSERLEEYADAMRHSVRRRVISCLRARIAGCYEKNLREELIASLEALLAADPYDEDSLLELMEAYRVMGQHAKALSLFASYSSLVAEKLGASPSARARDYFTKVLSEEPDTQENGPAKGSGERFLCRRRELASLLDSLADSNLRPAAVYVYGEAGIGKTALINRAISLLGSGVTVLSSRSCAVGEGYPYSAWNSVVSQIAKALEELGIRPGAREQSVLSGIFPGFAGGRRLNYNADISLMTERNPIVISGIIDGLLRKISAKRRIIAVFEDIHWFDVQSLDLLNAFISTASTPLGVIMSGRPESSRITLSMLQNLNARARWKITSLKLGPLRDDEISQICRQMLARDVLIQKGDGCFIRESEGIPLLLFEMLRAAAENADSDMTTGLGGLIMARIGELSDLQKNILAALSVFAAGAEPAQVAEAVGRPLDEILPAADELLTRELINERAEEGRVMWDFIHVKVRDCIYGSVSLSNRQELHRKVAEVLAKRYSPFRWDPNLGAMLRHHYRKSGQKTMELRQYIRELIFDITLNHDLFPVVMDKVLLSCSTPFSDREETERKISQAMSLLDEIRSNESVSESELAGLEASCFELAGGYRINWGEYQNGMVYIDEAIRLSKKYGFTDTHIHCLKHISYMNLQTENAPKLLASARELIALASFAGKPHYAATGVRFVGMAKLMLGMYDESEKIFSHSIKLFERLGLTGKSHTLSVLVAKCYIGEIFQIKGDSSTALAYFTECVDTCGKMGLYWGRSYFQMHAAGVGLDMGDMPLLYRHIDEAVSLFEGCRGGRCGSMLYSLKAIADAERGRLGEAESALKRAELFLSGVARKEWVATQHLAKAWFASKAAAQGKRTKAAYRASAAEHAQKSAALYRECGMGLRSLWIEDNFGPFER